MRPAHIAQARRTGTLWYIPAHEAQDLVHSLNKAGLDIPLGQVPGTTNQWYPGTRVYNDSGSYIIALDTEGKGFSDWRGMSTAGYSDLSDYAHATPTPERGLACTVSGHPTAPSGAVAHTQYSRPVSVEGGIGASVYSLWGA